MGGESGKNADSDSGGLEWGLADKNPCDDTAASKDIQIFFFSSLYLLVFFNL